MKMKWPMEMLLALAILVLPALAAHRAYAQIYENVLCYGPATGAFCDLVTPDALTCQDCVQTNCDVDCLYAYGTGANGAQAYYYCVLLGFEECNGSGSDPYEPAYGQPGYVYHSCGTYYCPKPAGTFDPRVGNPQYGYWNQFDGLWHFW